MPPAGEQEQNPSLWKLLGGYITFVAFVIWKYFEPVRHFMHSRVSQKYSEAVAMAFMLLIFSLMFYSRKLLKGYVQSVLCGIFLLAIITAVFSGDSVNDIERELDKQAVGNYFRELAASLLHQIHRLYGFFGRSGTAKTKIAETLVALHEALPEAYVNSRVFFLHNQLLSQSVEDFFNPSDVDSLTGWVLHGCGRETCYLILDDLHLLLDYYYIRLNQPDQVELFFSKLQALVNDNPSAVVIMIIEITSFSQSLGESRIANVTSNQELQKVFQEEDVVFNRLGKNYLPVYFKDVHHNYNEWRAAMLGHLNELAVSAVKASLTQPNPFDKGTKIEFDESVFKETRSLVYAFKDVKKFILPRLYWKIIDANTPRDCIPANDRILTVYLRDDFEVKCEHCNWLCFIRNSDTWTRIRSRLSLVPAEFYLRGMEIIKIIFSALTV